jgi:3-deoxy-manno-octulosonate cytidylyltransferase (CMP-KDO synthetase)
LPYTDKTYAADEETPVYHHVGAYAYRPNSLARYISWPERTLERLEGLEQLRLLEHGVKIRCVLVEARGRVFWELKQSCGCGTDRNSASGQRLALSPAA